MKKHAHATFALALALSSTTLLSSAAFADEGMWPYNMIPKAELQAKHGVTLDDAFLDRMMKASVRFNSGGSGSFVSTDGLVMTNHHVGADCIHKLSQGANDYMANGFVARTRADEQKCPDLEINQLLSIEDVTARVHGAGDALGVKAADAEKGKARKAESAKIEKECADATGLRCDVVSLSSGAFFHLYRYKKFTDVRLVFAPEFQAAFFGGDPDNFTYPRTCLDVAFFRVYDGEQPAKTPEHMPFSAEGAKDGDLTFVSGHPGSTGRFSTVSNLKMLRDTTYPFVLDGLTRMKSALSVYMAKGESQKKAAQDDFFSVENSLKAIGGFQRGLTDPSLMSAAEAKESDLKTKVKALKDGARLLEAWTKLDAAYASFATFYKQYAVVERFLAPGGTVLGIAKHLVRLSDELPKKNEDRLPEYRDSALASLEHQLFSEAPIDDGLEVVKIALGLENMISVLGANDATVKALLAGKTPFDRATEIVNGTKLKDIATRRALKEGGKAALDAAKDPAIQFFRAMDPLARKMRKRFEDEVESVEHTYSGRIVEAYNQALGASIYPDATFTLRLNWGVVKGYTENGQQIAWRTQLGDLYRKNKRAADKDPYKLPARFRSSMGNVDFAVPYNFVSTNDIIGGNSGSPVFNQKGEIVGLIFDSNLSQLPNRFLYRENTERAVSVHSEAIVHALHRVYEAGHIAKELGR